MKQHLLLLVGLFLSTLAFAQQTVSGTVTDELGDPVTGATVLITGTTTGTSTDFDGRWELSIPEGSESIIISYIGYDKQTVMLDGGNVIDVQLTEGVALSEVVVTGYSVGSKRDATGAIATIDAEKLQAIPSSNVEQQLQGRASGVTVITNGQPGTQSKVRIRGFGSLSANQPLFVVDGVPTQDISFLAPDDIATTTILKDAASASIYGSRASNGVIVYTTKKGTRDGKVKISYDGLIGTRTRGQGQPILTPQEQADYTLIAFRNARINNGQNPDTTYSHPQYGQNVTSFTVPDFIVVGDRFGLSESDVDLAAEAANYSEDPNNPYMVTRSNRAGTDWYKEITRPATLQRHSLGFSGGSDGGRFYIGLNAQDQDGILVNQEFKRYGFRANSEFDLGNRVRVGENIQFNYGSTLGLIGGAGGQNVSSEENDVLLAFRLAPAIPVRNEFGGYGGTRAQGFANPTNPVANREQQDNNTNRNLSAFGNVYAEVDIIEGLFFRSLVGGNYGTFAGRFFNRAQYENAENSTNVGYGEFSGFNYNWVFTNTVNFNYDLGSAHNIQGLVGYEALSTNNGYSTNSSGQNPFSTDPTFVNIGLVQNPVVFSGYGTPNNYASILGQLQYNYNSKYYVTLVGRQDQSSGFEEDVRKGFFPAVSAAWRVTGESFMQPSNTISDLKIRAGYGEMGNAGALDANNRFNLLGGDVGSSFYDITGTNSGVSQGFRQTQIANPGAQWETSTTINIGAEISMFRSKLDVIVDLWQRENTDILLRQPLLDVYGEANRPFSNLGTITNQGIDLEITYRDRIATDLAFEATITGSFLKNNIDKLSETIDFIDAGGTRIGSPVRNFVGQPLSSFFGFQVESLWQSTAEIDAANAAAGATFQDGAAPGRFRFADVNGRDPETGELTGIPDGVISDADRTQIGNPIPTFTGGINLRLEYKGFDIETFLYSSIGNDIFNFSKWYTDFYASFEGAAISTRVKDSWTPQNTDTDQPIFENVSNFSTNSQVNSFYVEDGSYLRMQLLTIGYTLPSKAFDSTFSRFRVYASANNLFTVTGYQGLDPQVGGAADTNFGIDIGNFPVTRTFNFGVGLTF